MTADADRERVLARVSRETAVKLDHLAAELLRWQQVKNLVGPQTLAQLWNRHIADSLQLLPICAKAGDWVDLGTGGGFPGLIVAIQRTEALLGTTHLVESNHRKAAFLRHAVRVLGLDAQVLPARIETLDLSSFRSPAVVSARALAPLHQLIAWSIGLLRRGATGIFPKGQDVDSEIEEAARYWDFAAVLHPSLTDADARIVELRVRQQAEQQDVR